MPADAAALVGDQAQVYAGNGTEWLLEQPQEVGGLSPGESGFLRDNPWALRRSCGTIIHRMVANALREAGFTYFTIGPDFSVTLEGEDVLIELTTEGQVAAHVARGGEYLVAQMVTYILAL